MTVYDDLQNAPRVFVEALGNTITDQATALTELRAAYDDLAAGNEALQLQLADAQAFGLQQQQAAATAQAALAAMTNTYNTHMQTVHGNPPPPPPPPPVPTGLTAVAGDAQVELDWDDVAASYRVYRSATASGPWSLAADAVTASTRVVTGLTNGTAVSLAVSSVVGGVESARCTPVTVTPHAAVTPPPVDRSLMIFGAATTNNQADFNTLNNAWGPIRLTREYDSGGGFKPVDQYSWYSFAKTNFDYIVFSADEEKTTASYQAIANGTHDAKILAMVNSVRTKLAGKKGVICLGNEPNTAAVTPSVWRAAMEHCIDTYGYEPAPGFHWGVAFSNYNVWGAGDDSGKNWLPRRYAGPFCVETHFYGRTDYGDPEQALGRTLVPTVRSLSDKWYLAIGEMSAQEDSGHTKKAKWFKDVADYCQANDFAYMAPFDTNVGGSADVATSEPTRLAVKAIANRCSNNNWS